VTQYLKDLSLNVVIMFMMAVTMVPAALVAVLAWYFTTVMSLALEILSGMNKTVEKMTDHSTIFQGARNKDQ